MNEFILEESEGRKELLCVGLEIEFQLRVSPDLESEMTVFLFSHISLFLLFRRLFSKYNCNMLVRSDVLYFPFMLSRPF